MAFGELSKRSSWNTTAIVLNSQEKTTSINVDLCVKELGSSVYDTTSAGEAKANVGKAEKEVLP